MGKIPYVNKHLITLVFILMVLLLLPKYTFAVGKIVFVSDRTGLMQVHTMNGDGSDIAQLTYEDYMCFWPRWSPDGDKVAYLLQTTPNNDDGSLCVIDQNGDNRHLIKYGGVNVAYGPSGLTWIDADTLIYVSHGLCDEQLWRIDLDGSNNSLVLNPSEVPLQPDYNSEVDKIVYQGQNCGFQMRGLFTIEPDGTLRENIFYNGLDCAWPKWNPEGTHLVFDMSTPFDNTIIMQICTITSDGSEYFELPGINGGSPDWAYNGTMVIYNAPSSWGQEDDDIWLVHLDGSSPTRLTDDSYLNIMADWFDIPEIHVSLDIKPGSCVNPLNRKSRGVLPSAILGSEDFDVTEVDASTICLEGVAALRYAYEDVATQSDPYDCNEKGPDGYTDLTLKFDNQEVADLLRDMHVGDVILLELTGNLKEEFGGTPVYGEDIVIIRK